MPLYSAIAFLKEKGLYEEFVERRNNDEQYKQRKEHVKKYKEEHKEEFKKHHQKYYSENKDKVKYTVKKWQQENRDQFNAYNRERYKKLKEIKSNKK